MWHNWLLICSLSWPFGSYRSRAVGARADGQPPTLSSPVSRAGAKNSVRKFVRQNATPALRPHQPVKRGQPEAAANAVWANDCSPPAVSSGSFPCCCRVSSCSKCKVLGLFRKTKKCKTVGMPVAAGLPMLATPLEPLNSGRVLSKRLGSFHFAASTFSGAQEHAVSKDTKRCKHCGCANSLS